MRAEKGEFILSKEDLKNINESETHMPLQEKDFDNFLFIQAALGKIVYFNVQRLSEWIIINPLCLIQILKSIVTIEQFWKEGSLNDVFMQLNVTGILSKSDLVSIWSQNDYELFLPHIDYIIELLCHLDILVKQTRYDQENAIDTNTYFVPCMMTTPVSSSLIDSQCSCSECLVYKFEESLIPSGVSYRILSSCLSMWNVKQEGSVPHLYAGFAVFVLNDREVTVTIQADKIFVYISNKNFKKKEKRI